VLGGSLVITLVSTPAGVDGSIRCRVRCPGWRSVREVV